MYDSKAMCFYLDWGEVLRELDGENVKKLILAMIAFVGSETEPPVFDDPVTRVASTFIFQQLRRSRERSGAARKAGIASGRARRPDSASEDRKEEPTAPETEAPVRDTPQEPAAPSSSGSGESALAGSDERFARLWEQYPKKVRFADAKQMFSELSPDEATYEKMLKALEIQKQSPGWKEENGRYVPQLANWIADRRFDGVVEAENEDNGTFDVNDFFQLALKRSYEEVRSRKRNRDDEGSPKDK